MQKPAPMQKPIDITNNHSTNQTVQQTATGLKIVAPANGVYLGAYDFLDGIRAFEQAVGKKVALLCPNDISEPARGGCVEGGVENTLPGRLCTGWRDACYNAGYITNIGLETSLGFPNAVFTPQDIIDGKIDAELRTLARDIKAWGKPVFWMYPREPIIQPGWGYDGGGYGPSGSDKYMDIIEASCPGLEVCPQLFNQYQSSYGDSCSTPGDNKCRDGRERYRDMCRHIHDVVESECPGCVTWVMGAMVPDIETDGYKSYYPGSAYVDWHAFDLYPAGEQAPKPFDQAVGPYWAEALSIDNKPVMIVEFGLHSYTKLPGDGQPRNIPVDRASWFEDFFEKVRTTPAKLGAVIYWQMGSEAFDGSNTRIETGDAAAAAWRAELQANPSFWLSEVTLANGQTLSASTWTPGPTIAPIGNGSDDGAGDVEGGDEGNGSTSQCYTNCMAEAGNTAATCNAWCAGQGVEGGEGDEGGDEDGATSTVCQSTQCYIDCMAEAGNTAQTCTNWCVSQGVCSGSGGCVGEDCALHD